MRDRCSAQRTGDGVSSSRLVALVALGVLAALLFSPPARALSPPEVYLRELDASDVPAGGWVPLAGATVRSVNGYEVGVRLQDTGQPGNRQRILVRVTSVPDGHPDQRNVSLLCFSQSGTAGQIAGLAEQRLRYEGDGAYALAVTVSTGADASANCAAGPTTAGSFTASALTTVRFVGRLLFLDWRDPSPFSGLQIDPPPGSGGTDVRCARDPRRAPDGSLTGSRVVDKETFGAARRPLRIDSHSLFRVAGRWACVARGVGGGVIPGAWSAPTAAQIVQRGFYDGSARLVDPRGPTYLLTERLDPSTAGGILGVTFRTGTRGPRARVRTRVRRGGLAVIRFRLPRLRAGETYRRSVIWFSFAGTRFVAGRPSFPVVGLVVQRKRGGRVEVRFSGRYCRPLRC